MNKENDASDGSLKSGNYRLTYPSGRQFFLISLLSIAVYGLIAYLNWPDLAQVADRIRTDLPPGTSLTKIDRYFTERKIFHGFDQEANKAWAWVYTIRGSFPPVEKDVQITISLDKNQNLTGIWFEPVYTGP